MITNERIQKMYLDLLELEGEFLQQVVRKGNESKFLNLKVNFQNTKDSLYTLDLAQTAFIDGEKNVKKINL